MNRILIAIDCQNDFITGALRNEDAIKKVPKIVNYIKKFDGKIICTQDTHYENNYFDTLEGKKLPIKHCIINTEGWKINDEILTACLSKENALTQFIQKYTFGSIDILPDNKDIKEADEIYILGFCTDICVISNTLILRAKYPNKRIIVLNDLCSGTCTNTHISALTVMKSCQIDIE